MPVEQNIATERVFMTDAKGVRRLVAAPGDPIPEGVATYTVTSRQDPVGGGEPLDGYDALSEEEAIAILPDLSPELLAGVQAYERKHLARGSITQFGETAKVVTSAKRAEQPALEVPATSVTDGYDSMSPAELTAEVARRNAERDDADQITPAGTGANGNVVKKDLVKALRDDDASAAS